MEIKAKQALELWHAVMAQALRDGHSDLTVRQLALLLHVYLRPAPHTVRGLAEGLNMSKPAVTRALDRLSKEDYVRRKVDQDDRRSILVQRTVAGSVFLRGYGDTMESHAADLD